MSSLLNQTLSDGEKFIVVDEGIDVTYSKNLITSWLLAIRKREIEIPINIVLFSTPKCAFSPYLESSQLTNFQIHDYFSLNIDDKNVDAHQPVEDIVDQHINSILVIDCLGSLGLQIGRSKTCRFIERLARNHKFEVFCIYRRDFYNIIPRIESLGNIYVKLEKSERISFGPNIYYEISVTQRKSINSAVCWGEMISQNIETHILRSERLPDNLNRRMKINKSEETRLKPEASFRLEMSEREIQQRDSLTLPYILSDNPDKESKIFYVPDDYDEEDPDDDLEI